jgi:hypothetical protein
MVPAPVALEQRVHPINVCPAGLVAAVVRVRHVIEHEAWKTIAIRDEIKRVALVEEDTERGSADIK